MFVDAADSGLLERFASRLTDQDIRTKAEKAAACLAGVAARLGVLRLADPFGLRRLPPDAAAQAMLVLYRVEPAASISALDARPLARGAGERSPDRQQSAARGGHGRSRGARAGSSTYLTTSPPPQSPSTASLFALLASLVCNYYHI